MTGNERLAHHDVVVIGGGNAGLSVAGRLHRYGMNDVAVIEPRSHHRYQPLFSHVAGGTAKASQAHRPQGDVTPRGVTWRQDRVVSINPDASELVLALGTRMTYGHLVVCPGIQKDFDRIPGLVDALATPYVSSHYEFEYVAKTSRLLRDVREGTVVFVQPAGPATCAGASQKPMYLACAYWRAKGVLDNIRVVMLVPDPTVFGIPAIDSELERKIDEYGIELRTSTELIEVDGDQRQIVVRTADGEPERMSYDVLNVVPPQSAPDWLKASALPAPGDAAGFVDVDPYTLRHRRHHNVWSLGDAAATLNSKSGGALREQAKVLAGNLRDVKAGKSPSARYSGYSVAPFTVSRGTVVFAEFDDRYRQKPTVPFWPGLARERRLTWVFDRHILPWVYWNLILKGRA
ncbi:MAG: NAD(P)/FAD-dependent oxidoreductase [Rhodoglobus sp.]|uniref:NAD(P)/FAD-dependent oxidoreductase n=1 Tax=Salinibacterium sp. G-O1 TaxID=3046208 RepID=UPI0024BAFF1D|nr:FAD/NAD(P)-binding oxidoreductase [Salinibacterium sp. G-O1]MDJ0334550.1 FAD/NAD(P)-binding oxidoreductase [Salinibacterium sp. G-O1]